MRAQDDTRRTCQRQKQKQMKHVKVAWSTVLQCVRVILGRGGESQDSSLGTLSDVYSFRDLVGRRTDEIEGTLAADPSWKLCPGDIGVVSPREAVGRVSSRAILRGPGIIDVKDKRTFDQTHDGGDLSNPGSRPETPDKHPGLQTRSPPLHCRGARTGERRLDRENEGRNTQEDSHVLAFAVRRPVAAARRPCSLASAGTSTTDQKGQSSDE